MNFEGMNAALGGITDGFARFERAAGALARDVSPGAVIDLKRAELQVRASAKVARVQSDNLGLLLDELA